MRSTIILIATLSSALAFGQHEHHAGKTLYDRIGLQKIAAGSYNCIEMEAKDEMLNMNTHFKAANDAAPVPVVQFALTGFLANVTGGPQTPTVDIAALDKAFMFTKQERAHAWEIRWMAFEKAGVSKTDFMELRAAYERKFNKAKPMMPMQEMFATKDSLYARLGGFAPISMVINDFINMLATDPVTLGNPQVVKSLTTGHITAAGLKYLVTEQLVAASGGPLKYTGRSMAASHAGLMITEDQWTSAANILKTVLDKYHVPEKEQGEIFSVVGGTKSDIVGK